MVMSYAPTLGIQVHRNTIDVTIRPWGCTDCVWIIPMWIPPTPEEPPCVE